MLFTDLGSIAMHFATATTIRTTLTSNFRLRNPCGLYCCQGLYRQVRWCLGHDEFNARFFHLCRMLWVSHPCASYLEEQLSVVFFAKRKKEQRSMHADMMFNAEDS